MERPQAIPNEGGVVWEDSGTLQWKLCPAKEVHLPGIAACEGARF